MSDTSTVNSIQLFGLPRTQNKKNPIIIKSIFDHDGLELRLCASVVPGSLAIDEAKMARLFLYAADGARFLEEQRCKSTTPFLMARHHLHFGGRWFKQYYGC